MQVFSGADAFQAEVMQAVIPGVSVGAWPVLVILLLGLGDWY